ncbi:dihydrofolate reductase [Thorsellia kenyensis]|uniref:dihydrofolate reductase n=1 Tax=Thorsellia kenyensis TaxID=1549888 RepID=A0ABV6CDM1_9GAMM
MKISLIAAIDISNAIGLDNKMLWHLPADFKWFKKHTLGKPVIMGRKTYQSIGKALPGRTNIVLTKQAIKLNDAVVAHSLQESLEIAKRDILKKSIHLNSHDIEQLNEIMIIGGATIYHSSLDLADRLYITEVKHEFNADAFFPKFNGILSTSNNLQFNLSYEELYLADENNAFDMVFKIYDRVNK